MVVEPELPWKRLYQQTSAFTKQPRDELESVRISCAIIFLASIFQFAIWTTALLQEGETLQPSARFGGCEHAFMFAKLALYPCASLLAFACTCALSSFSTAIFHAMQIAVPFAFLLLRLLVRLALAGLRALRGLVGPMLARPAPGAADEAQSPLLPAPCVHRVSDAIQPSHPLSSPSPPAPNPSQHQSLFH